MRIKSGGIMIFASSSAMAAAAVISAAVEPVEDVAARRRRIGIDEFEALGDPIQPRLDGGIGDAENLLHLLDRAMASDERRHENLVIGREPGQLR